MTAVIINGALRRRLPIPRTEKSDHAHPDR
jgi:hypothetical protein